MISERESGEGAGRRQRAEAKTRIIKEKCPRAQGRAVTRTEGDRGHAGRHVIVTLQNGPGKAVTPGASRERQRGGRTKTRRASDWKGPPFSTGTLGLRKESRLLPSTHSQPACCSCRLRAGGRAAFADARGSRTGASPAPFLRVPLGAGRPQKQGANHIGEQPWAGGKGTRRGEGPGLEKAEGPGDDAPGR